MEQGRLADAKSVLLSKNTFDAEILEINKAIVGAGNGQKNENEVLDIRCESGGRTVLEKFKELDSFQKLPVRGVAKWCSLGRSFRDKRSEAKVKRYFLNFRC